MNRLFNNPRKAVIGIIAVLALFMSYKQCSATEVEAGLTYASEFNNGYSLSVIERILDDKFDLGLTLISEQDYDRENLRLANNGNVWMAFVAKRPEHFWKVLPSEVTVGAAYWIKTSRFIGCNQGFQLGLKWRFGDFSVGARHWSNAGSCVPNRGQDLLTFGWRFD